MFCEETEHGRYLFPPRLVPYLSHPRLSELNDKKYELLTQHLYQYLHFTAHFEPTVVNRALRRIAVGNFPASVPRATRVDALKIYTDEGYHALASLDLIEQIENATGVPSLPYDFRLYLNHMGNVVEAYLPDDRLLGQLMQVIIFETSITSILADMPSDRNLVTAVREIIREHAIDERMHHAFFALLFPELWSSLRAQSKTKVASVLPVFIKEVTRPYLYPIKLSLLSSGLEASAVAEVLNDIYSEASATEYARDVSRHTINLFIRTGVLDIPGASEAFAMHGLL